MPIPFNCPHCGKFFEVEDGYAGQTGPCAACGKTINIPGVATGVPFATAPRARSMSPLAIIGIVLGVMAVCSLPVIVILVALLLPAVQAAREAARRAQCMNNEKQILLAMLNTESATARFPPPAIIGEKGPPLLSWRVALLPFLEQQVLYQRFKRDETWDSPSNQPLVSEMPPQYRCPSNGSGEVGKTDYVVVTGHSTMYSAYDRGISMRELGDGASNTIALVESHQSKITWSEPRDLDFDQMQFQPNGGPNEINSKHSGAVVVGMADGSVHTIRNSIDPEVLKALLTRNGGETAKINDN